METMPGTIIVLNGTAAAGKSSLAKAVQDIFPDPYFLLGIDTFVINVFPARFRGRGERAMEGISLIPAVGGDESETEWRFGPYGYAMMSVMHHAVAATAASGHNVVVDYCLQDAAWMDEWVALWAHLPVLLVHVYCPLDVLEERAAARSDRTGPARGVPRWQFLRGLVHCPYDLTVDTSQMDAVEGALHIQQCLHSGVQPTAFRTLIDAGG
jgi:chloramphenicol 3-O phosphotransferase